MKLSKIALAALFLGAIAFAVPQAQAADGGKSGTHRQDGSHGHKGKKGGKSADHRQDGKHGKKGGKSGDHRKDGEHRNPKSGNNGR